MINIACQDHGTIVVTVHDDSGGATEVRIHDTPGHLEVVADIATSVPAVVTVNGTTQHFDAHT